MTAHSRRPLRRVAITAGSAALFVATLAAQSAPPIPGATGVVQPEGTENGATAAVAAAAGKVVEGTRHLLHAIGIGGGNSEKDKSVDPLEALQLGMTVVVRDDVSAAAVSARAPGATQKTTEARVIDINRRTGVIVIRLADRTTEKLQLAARSGADVGPDAGAAPEAGGTISVSYTDGAGRNVVLSFRKAS